LSSFGNNGCDGGEDYRAYQWIMKHGLPTEEEYGGYLGQVSVIYRMLRKWYTKPKRGEGSSRST
jgi:hypothetical protein